LIDQIVLPILYDIALLSRLYWVQAGWQYDDLPVNEVHTRCAPPETMGYYLFLCGIFDGLINIHAHDLFCC